MRLRSASRWRCGGVETDAAQNGPGSSLPQSPPEAAATGPRPNAPKGAADGCAPRCPAQGRAGRGGEGWSIPKGRPRGSSLGAPPPCGDPAVSVHSLHACLSFSHHPAPIHFYCPLPRPTLRARTPAPARPIHPHPCAEPSSPRSSCSRYRLGLRGSPVPARPRRLEGRGAGTTRQRCAAAPLLAWAWRGPDPAPSA